MSNVFFYPFICEIDFRVDEIQLKNNTAFFNEDNKRYTEKF